MVVHDVLEKTSVEVHFSRRKRLKVVVVVHATRSRRFKVVGNGRRGRSSKLSSTCEYGAQH